MIPQIRDVRGSLCTSRQDIADVFSMFFTNLYDGSFGNFVVGNIGLPGDVELFTVQEVTGVKRWLQS